MKSCILLLDLQQRGCTITLGMRIRSAQRGSSEFFWMLCGPMVVAALFAFLAGSLSPLRAQSPSHDSQLQDPPGAALPSFEVVSIKQDNSGWGGMNGTPGLALHISLTNIPLKALVRRAFEMDDFQISGGPDWINRKRYDIEADVNESLFQRLRKLPKDEQFQQLRLMEQSLLADRFKLKVTHTTKQLRAYDLVLVKDTAKLKVFAVDPFPSTPTGLVMISFGGSRGDQIELIKANVGQVARGLTAVLAAPVIDQTGVTGNYSLKLRWTDETQLPAGATPNPDFDRSLTAALQELGLKLEPTTTARDTIAIDHIEEPSPN